MRKKFLRRNTKEYLRLGRKRRKLQKWRKPKGRDNKMRLNEKGRAGIVKIGYKQSKNIRGMKEGKKIKMIQNISEMKLLEKGDIITIGRMGVKKKKEIAKIAEELGIKIINANLKKFLKAENVKEIKK
ncbi:MAG: eL32 family ribosomal protein [Candidatus Pacearchaeota archaeon]